MSTSLDRFQLNNTTNTRANMYISPTANSSYIYFDVLLRSKRSENKKKTQLKKACFCIYELNWIDRCAAQLSWCNRSFSRSLSLTQEINKHISSQTHTVNIRLQTSSQRSSVWTDHAHSHGQGHVTVPRPLSNHRVDTGDHTGTQRSYHPISCHLISSGCAEIGHSHGELDRMLQVTEIPSLFLSKTKMSELHKISCTLHARGSVLLWRRCNTLCTSGFVADDMFSHNGPNGGVMQAQQPRCNVVHALAPPLRDTDYVLS